MLDTLISALVNLKAMGMLIAGFCFLIFVHELGHFLAAKAVNCKVTQFAIGFGPALFSWRKGIGFRRGSTEPEFMARVNEYADKRAALAEQSWVGFRDVPVAERKFTERHLDEARTVLGMGETEYRANMLLILGGYVRLLGQEDLNPEAVSEDPRSFNRIKAIPKAIILSAGVFMNFIFAIVFFVTAFMAGVKFPPAVVGHVANDMPAAKTYADGHQGEKEFLGLKPGDRILQANGNHVTDFNDMRMRIALTSPGDTIALTIERDGVTEPLTYTLTPQKPKDSRFAIVGLGEPISLEIAKAERDADQPPLSPELASRGVRPGMAITAVAGKTVKRFDQVESLLAAARGKPVDVTFTDPETNQSVAVPLAATPEFGVLGLVPVARIENVSKKSPAQAAGLQSGDVLVRIGERYWPADSRSVSDAVRRNQGREFSMVVLRQGKNVKIDAIAANSAGVIGIAPGYEPVQPVIGSVNAKSPLSSIQPRLPAGTRIITVNGEPISSFGDYQRLLQDAVDPSRETSVSIEVERDINGKPRETHAVKFTAEQAKALKEAEWGPPSGIPMQVLTMPLVAGDPLEAITLGFSKTRQYMFQTYQSLYLLIIGAVPASEMHGMIGIVQQGTIVARDHGWAFLVFFLGLISINLVVMNFLPIPILDGGQMVFLIIEKIKGSPVSIRAQTIATYVGLALIGTLLLMTLYFDTARLFGFN